MTWSKCGNVLWHVSVATILLWAGFKSEPLAAESLPIWLLCGYAGSRSAWHLWLACAKVFGIFSVAVVALLVPVLASASPILTLPSHSAIVWDGTAGIISRDDVTGPIQWTSTEHLRNACFAEWSADSLPTGEHARPATCVHEDFLDGLYTYTLNLEQIDVCEKAQGDTELEAGGSDGVWIVVQASRMCAGRISIHDDHQPVSPDVQPVPEPGTVQLCAAAAVLYLSRRVWKVMR